MVSSALHSTATESSSSAPLRSKWPYGVVAGLALAIATNLTMVAIAVRHPSTPASADHWQDSLHFDAQYEARRASLALGWQVDLTVGDVHGGMYTVEMKVLDRDKQPIQGLHGEIIAERSDSSAFDRQAQWQEQKPGSYLAHLPLAIGGSYRAKLSLSDQTLTWQGERFLHFDRVQLDRIQP